jgi:hypothetical protein
MGNLLRLRHVLRRSYPGSPARMLPSRRLTSITLQTESQAKVSKQLAAVGGDAKERG